MFVHEIEALKQLGIPIKQWGDSYRVKIRGKTGRFTYVSNLSRPYNREQIAKLNPKAFPKGYSVKKRMEKLEKAINGRKEKHTVKRNKTNQTHTFEHMRQTDVMTNLEKVLKSQKKAFKVAIELGYNLIDLNTGERRYWAPGWNTRITDNTIAINKKSDIQSKVLDFLASTDLSSKINYPSSNYKLDEITAISIRMYNRNHVLGDSQIEIPDIIKKNQHVINFPKTENKCVFHCIAYHLQSEGKDYRYIMGLVKQRFKEYCQFKEIEYSLPCFKSFKPLDILEFDDLEDCFRIKINVYEMDVDTGDVSRIRESDASFENELNILDYKGHAMYIPRIEAFHGKYCCDRCPMIFETCQKLTYHKKTKCQVMTKEVFVKQPKVFQPAGNMIKKTLKRYDVKGVDPFIDHFIVYDFEAILAHLGEQRGETTTYETKHVPVSVSICDSLTKVERCFVSEDPKDLLAQMFDYVYEVAGKIQQYNISKFKRLIDVILKVEQQFTKDDLENFYEEHLDYSNVKEITGYLCQTIDELENKARDAKTFFKTIKQVPLVGFNSGRYDINLIKKDLFSVLQASDPDNIKMVIKNPSYMCISTENLKMLDISNYLPPCSYEKYLETYLGKCKCEDKIRCLCGLGKGIFPYEYITDFNKLNETEVPPREAFNSRLRNTEISDDDYERVKFIWSHYNMKTVKDLLIWYNNLDVKPFVEAITKQKHFYKDFGLDMLIDGVSLPGLAEKVMYQTLFQDLKPIQRKKGEPFSFPLDRFKGYRKQDEEAEREYDMDIDCVNEILRKQRYSCRHCGIELDESNASVDRVNNQKGHTNENIVLSCIHCNVSRKTMSMSAFAYQKKIEYNADSIIWSIDADNADIYHKMKANIAGGPSIIFNRFAKAGETFIRNGDKLVQKVIGYDANALYLWCLGNEMPCGRLSTIDVYDNIIEDITNDKIFGYLECDIETPEHLKDYFGEMTPIFKNIEIDPLDKEVVGEFMYDYNMNRENKNVMKSKKLIGSYFGQKILIYTPLLKWYLSHGMVITKTYSFIKCSSGRPFQKFMNTVSNARRKGDSDKSQAMVAEMMKLIGNAAFGRSGMDKSKHKETKFETNESKIADIVEKNRFYDVEELGDSFEITLKKASMKLNNPIHVSIAIYQLAKLRMLQFYYDCIDFYFDRSDFEYQEMDTDSAYIAFSADKPFETLVKPELKQHFQEHKYDWFPRDYNDEVAKYDRRTAGLFKEEWSGYGIVSLSSKNYICYLPDEGHKQKVSAKGVQQANGKNSDILNPTGFESVIRDRITLKATNKGFRVDKDRQNIITYKQVKNGLSFYYDKRQVLSDGISTIPLNL